MRHRSFSWAILIATLAAAPPALAQGAVEIGGFGSFTHFDKTMGLDDQTFGGARLSVFSGSDWNNWALEIEGGFAPKHATGFPVRYIPARARLAYAPTWRNLSVMLGAGAVRSDYNTGVGPVAAEWGYSGLAGLKLQLGSFMALRVDGIIDYTANPVGKTPTHMRSTNRAVQAGLSFPIWRQRPIKPMEPKAEPKPEPKPEVKPEAKPEKSSEPIVDTDHDGVADMRDACPNTPGGQTVDGAGCSVFRDTDGDGVIDIKDGCPTTPVGEAVDGRGCTLAKDADKDGVADERDRCPNTAPMARVDVAGCPIAEAKPAEPAKPLFKDNERTVALRGVNFATWSDELTPSSLAILDDVARQLIDMPDVKIEVAGHTDSGGARARNLRLSLARAEAVRAYLVMRGVPAERLIARGYGPDRPLASNKTAQGRALNRRVELHRLD